MFNARFYLATNIKSLQSIAFDMSIEMPKIIKEVKNLITQEGYGIVHLTLTQD